VAEHRAVDAHVAVAVALEVGADEVVGGPLQHAHHPPQRAQVGPVGLAQDPHQHDVAGGGVVGVVLAHAHLGAGLAVDGVRPDEAGAGGGAAERPGDGPVRRGGADGVVLARLDAAVAQELPQGAAELGVLRGGHAELAGEGLGLERLVVGPPDGGEDLVGEVGHP
jgi:hypothetical protein